MENALFRKNFIWNVIGSTLNGFNSMFFMIIISRINGTDTAGVFTLLFSVANLLWVIGIYAGRTFQITDKNEYYNNSDYVLNRVLSCALMLVIGFGYCLFRQYDLYRTSLVMILTFMRVLEAGADVLYGLMQKNDELYKCGISLTLKTLIGLVGLIALDLITKNIHLSFLLVSLIWLGIMIVYDLPSSRRYITDRFDLKKALQLFGSGFYSFAFYFLNVYLANATKYALEGRVSSTAQAMYGIVLMPATLINLCAIYLLQPYINELRKQYKDEKITEFRKSLRLIIGGTAVIGILALAAATLLGVPVLNFVYKIDIRDYLPCLQLIIIGATIIAIVTALSTALTTMRNTRVQFYIYLIVSLIALVITPRMVDASSVLGASQAYLLISILQLVFYLAAYYMNLKKWRTELAQKAKGEEQ